MAAPVERFDFTRLDASRVKQTSQGFLTVAGRLTRVGVLDYYRADGSKYRELRHPEDVFDAGSLASLAMAPVTDLHGGMVSPDNVQALSVGVVMPGVTGGGDGPFVTGAATIQRADTIKAVVTKRRTELSPGYRCVVEDGTGTWDGSAYGLGVLNYDGRQREIDYNHLAVGPRDWGRSGRDVALHMDSMAPGGAFARCDAAALGGFVRARLDAHGRTEAEAARALDLEPFELGIVLDGFRTPAPATLEKLSGLIDVPVEKLEGLMPHTDDDKGTHPEPGATAAIITTGTPMKKITIVMDGISYEVEIADALASTFAAQHEKMRSDAAQVPELQGKLLAAEKVGTDTQAKLDAATDPAAIAAAIASRTQVIQDAKKIAPDLEIDERADDKAIKVAALVASGYDAAVFEKCDGGFVDGAFGGALRSVPAAPATTTPATVPGPAMHTDASQTPATPADLTTPTNAKTCTVQHSDAARERMMARGRAMSSNDLDMTKAHAQAR